MAEPTQAGLADRLHALYLDELKRSLEPPVDPAINESQTAAMIQRGLAERPARYEGSDGASWVWSDLHLGDVASALAFGRPFRTADEMDRTLFEAWDDLVGPTETIICLGDAALDGSTLAHHQHEWENAPGHKWLVLGNHDVDPVNHVRPLAVDRSVMALAAPGNPPLLLTHVPLLQVPAGCVNVHGHIHQADSPTWHRHVNVSVEQLDYRPVRLSDIRRLARRMMEGRSRPEATTRARLDMIERSTT